MREGWIETTLDAIAEVVMGQSPDGKTYNEEGKGLPFMQGSAEFGEHNPVPDKWCSDPKKIAEPGDLLLSVRAPVGDTNFADQRIAVGRGLSIIRANKESITEFIRLVIQLNVAELIASSGSGMFASITGKNLKEFKVNLPPLPQQKRIVDLISSVDSYIEALQKQLEGAKNSRNAVLHELMSRALDENRKPLIELAKLQRGHDLPTQDRIEGSIPVVASNGVVGFHNTHKAIGPGVVTGRSGTIGKVIYIDDDYWPLNTTLYVIDFKGNLPKFVALVLETLKLENYAGGSTVPSLDRNVLSQVPVPYPSIKEQERIVGIIQSLDEVVAKSEHAISQAKILRTGLLSDLLSGTHEIPASYDKVIGAA